jgi:hypothetical protein
MRELDAWHGDHRRPAADLPVDSHATRARDAPRYEVLRDPAARVAAHLELRKAVAAVDAAAGKPQPEQAREARPEHSAPESHDQPAGTIASRREPPEVQEGKRTRPERRWLPSNETAQVLIGAGVAVSSLADAVSVLPGRWDAVVASSAAAIGAGIAWGNKRWKDKHGDRPEG